MSHTLISLLLFAQVGQDALSYPTTPTPLCPALLLLPFSITFPLCLSISSSLSTSPLSVFVPQGPVVQLKLSVTQRNPNWLSSAACYQLCTLCIYAPSLHRKCIVFTCDNVIIVGLDSLLSLQKCLVLLELQCRFVISC